MSIKFRVTGARVGARISVLLGFTFAAATAVASPAPPPVTDGIVQLRYTSPAAVLTTQVHLPLGTQNYYIGNYNLQTQTPAASFQGYCVDPFQYASTSYRSYEASTLSSFLSASAQKFADVSSLFAHAYADTLGNATKAAGFQLALWEVFNDDRNLTTGSVYKTSNTNAAAVTEANSLLASLLSGWTTPALNYELTIFSSSQAQDFLVATPTLGPSTTPIPEPDSAFLLLAGLGLLGLAARNRRRPQPAA